MKDIFGNWINNTDNLNKQFISAEPYEHIIIDNFFNEEYLNTLINEFPSINDKEYKWYLYNNPIEKKYALNNFEKLLNYNDLFKQLQTPEFVNIISQITSIKNLENDPHLHGAGVHYHPNGGKLDMHLDYSVHPITGKERRVNLIIYLNKEWKEEYNGDLQLWDINFEKPVRKYYPEYNRAVLFRTSDISYHGLPTPIKCPDNIGRKSLAIYYVSEPRDNVTKRYKAEYRPLPNQIVNEQLKQLYDIRKSRIITKDDLEEIYPNWENDGKGYW
jgi:Rps23 Pro-64 3,4-dihydroxylase Tpa1-like proline 4-hydroxylase